MSKIPKDFVAFDLETTGFSPPCRIIEIGAVKVRDGKIVEQFQTLVDPCCIIPAVITGITGIDQRMVSKASKIEDVLPDFFDFVGGLPVAAHNASFDMKFINFEACRLGYSFNNQVIDTLVLSRRYFPGLENHKLNTVARYIGVVNRHEHRGLYDAIAVAEILLQLSLNDVKTANG